MKKVLLFGLSLLSLVWILNSSSNVAHASLQTCNPTIQRISGTSTVWGHVSNMSVPGPGSEVTSGIAGGPWPWQSIETVQGGGLEATTGMSYRGNGLWQDSQGNRLQLSITATRTNQATGGVGQSSTPCAGTLQGPIGSIIGTPGGFGPSSNQAEIGGAWRISNGQSFGLRAVAFINVVPEPTGGGGGSSPIAPTLTVTTTCTNNQPVNNLSWTSSDGSNGYRIYRKVSTSTNINGTQIASINEGTLTYSDSSGLSNNSTYTYWVWTNHTGPVPTRSNPVNIATPNCGSSGGGGGVVGATPIKLSAANICQGEDSVIRLTWTGGQIGGGLFTTYQNPAPNGQNIWTLINTGSAYTVTTNAAVPGNTFSFNVRQGGNTSNTVTVTAQDCSTPEPVTIGTINLTVTPVCVGSNSVLRLSWNPVNATGYFVYVGNQRITALNSNTTSYDYQATPGILYGVRVDAINTTSQPATYTNSNTVTLNATNCAPPSAVTITGDSICQSQRPYARITYTAQPGVYYELISNGLATGITAQGTGELIDEIDAGQTENYVVRASNANGITNSNQVSVVGRSDCVPPTPTVTNLGGTSTCSNSNPVVTISWRIPTITDVSPTYKIIRDGQEIAADVAGFTYTDSDVSPGQTYSYVIDSDFAGLEASEAVEVTATTCLQPPAAVTLSGSSTCDTFNSPINNLAWTESSTADNYLLLRDSVEIQNLNAIQFADTNVSQGTSYAYLVRAANAVGVTDSNLLNLETTACAPDNNPPVAEDDAVTTDQNVTVNINVLSNDSDPDDNLNPDSISIVSDPANGSVSIQANNTVDYTPDQGFFGTDTFDYQVCDIPGLCDTATVTVTINEPNDEPLAPPVANDDSARTNENQAVNINVAANDSDPDNGLDLTSITITSNPANGSVSVNTDGTVDYTPNQDFDGQDQFEYQICDVDDLCDTAIVTVTIDNVPVPPGPFSLSIQELCTADSPEHILTWTASENAANYLVIRDGQTLTNTTETSYIDSSPTPGSSHQYIVRAENSDDTTESNTLNVVTQSCLPPDNPLVPPVANDDTARTQENQFVVIDVLANDVDSDGTLDPACLVILEDPAHGAVVVDNQTGLISYTPSEGFSGTDNFRYEICDNDNLTANALVTVVVEPLPEPPGPENKPPQAVDDEGETPYNQPIEINVPLNDTDPDDNLDPTCVKITRNPNNGSVVVNAENGIVTYTPNDGFAGTDNFEYSICDTEGLTDTATVTVAVANEPPTQLASTGAGLFSFFVNLWESFLRLFGLN
ncbi:tandem-95 repeat protein [Candidatus Berkelbacteria bacterium]|nr:tandem-95 repeat protein [Candidatus Berkelbacteria bacterium]